MCALRDRTARPPEYLGCVTAFRTRGSIPCAAMRLSLHEKRRDHFRHAFCLFNCLTNTPLTAGVFCVWMTGGRECASAPERVPLPGRTAINTAALLQEECGRGEGRKAAAVHQKQKARRRPPARCRSLRQHLPQPANIPAAPAQWEKRGGLRR